jgi:hypothetical protein
MLVAMRPAGSSPSTMLTVAKRALNATSGQFLPVNAAVQVVKELPEDRIHIPAMTQLDGQYIILVTDPKPVGQSKLLLRSNPSDLLTGIVALQASNIVGSGKRKREEYVAYYI